jgi:Protein of unknown function (DUF2795)
MTDDMSRAQPPRGLGELQVREGQPFPLARPLEEALRGAVFPLSAEQLVHVARENEASPIVLSLLSVLPRQQFVSLDAVTHALDEGAPQVRHLHP